MVAEEKPGAILAVLTPQDQTPVEKIVKLIVKFNQQFNLPIIPIFIGKEKIAKAIQIFQENNLVYFKYPEIAVQTIDYYYQASFTYNILDKVKINKVRLKNNLFILNKARQENRKTLYYGEGKEIIESYGLTAAEFYTNIDQVKKFPVVVKVDSPNVLHKTDRQGVILNISNFTELKKAYQKMGDSFPGEKIIIQPQDDIQQEIILGIKRDAIFGNIVLVGLGGIYTEILHKVEFFIPPVSQEYIKKQLQEKSLGFLFKKVRGRESFNLSQLAKIIYNFSQMALELEDKIEQVDINPLLIYNNQKKPLAVDVKFLLKD